MVDFNLYLCLDPIKFVFNAPCVYLMKLSIIIPTCDRPQFLNHAVTSALNNGGNDCEVIIVDDGLEKSASSLTFDAERPPALWIGCHGITSLADRIIST